MKLAGRYQRSNLLITLIVFMMASLAFYIQLHRILIYQVDEDLEIEQHEIEAYVSRHNALPENLMPTEDQVIRAEPASTRLPKPIRQTVKLRDEADRAKADFRQLVFTIEVGGSLYRVSVSKSLEATRGLTHSIGMIALITIGIMLLASFLLNRIILRRLWKPFYDTIDRLRSFKLGSHSAIELPQVRIDEFALLNTTLRSATGRAAEDYRILKEFTENASHELQTPLAIVRSKLDLLIQDEGLSEPQSSLIQDAYEAIGRMTNLNRSLLMLAKIEGGQFGEREPIDMKLLVERRLELMDSFLRELNITPELNLEPAVWQLNRALADVLLNNLLSNAIHHNRSSGRVRIKLEANSLAICNTSAQGPLDAGSIFTRFYKPDADHAGTGLGLAIVKQVCAASGCAISYRFDQPDMHCFLVTSSSWRTAP